METHTKCNTFLHSLLHFLSKYFTVYSHAKQSEENILLTTEKQIVHSLLLIEKIHMYLLYRDYLYEQVLSIHKEAFQQLKKDDLFNLLCEISILINHHPFQKNEHQKLCQQLISQILTYYSIPSSVNIDVNTPPPSPWRPEY